jgi:hypothetical protein
VSAGSETLPEFAAGAAGLEQFNQNCGRVVKSKELRKVLDCGSPRRRRVFRLRLLRVGYRIWGNCYGRRMKPGFPFLSVGVA